MAHRGILVKRVHHNVSTVLDRPEEHGRVAIVLSTISGMPCRWASPDRESRSQILPAGLPIVSQNSARVFSSDQWREIRWPIAGGKPDVQPEARQKMREQRVGCPIKLGRAYDIMAGFSQVQQRIHQCRLSGANSHRPRRTALKRGDSLFQCGGRWIAHAAIAMALDFEIKQRRCVIRAIERESGGFEYRNGYGSTPGARARNPRERRQFLFASGLIPPLSGRQRRHHLDREIAEPY